jgi:glycine cleavage system H protein
MVLTFVGLMAVAYGALAGIDRVIGLATGRSFAVAMAPGIGGAAVAMPIPAIQTASEDAIRVEGYAMPESLYYHQGHSWVKFTDSGDALVGIDDFATKLMGKTTSIKLPDLGDIRRQGEKGWALLRNDKTLDMAFPLDGEIVAINENLLEDPGALLDDPYGAGWLMKVKPHALKRNARNLLKGSIARSWMEESAARLRSVFSGDVGMVYQDGGLPEEGLARHIEPGTWQEIVSNIFMIDPE